jgi:aminomethyltransferase
MDEKSLKYTPLYQKHLNLKAKMVPFAGFVMPVQYSGIIDEHNCVRTKVGLFDVSHMGEIIVRGPDSIAFLNKHTPNDVSRLVPQKIQYSCLITPQGTFVDDLLVHCFSDDHYFICVNASNTDKDFQWLLDHKEGNVEIINKSAEYYQLALQGPKAQSILRSLVDIDLSTIKYYWFTQGKVRGKKAIISRTGYTGEDGFEIYGNPVDGPYVWDGIMDAGEREGIQPIGLGARDTLRLEASMPLYGNDIDDTTTVLEADLQWIVKFDKGNFLGKAVLEKQLKEGIEKKLVGFEMIGPGIGRHGYKAFYKGKEVGWVTSGTHAPFIKKNIGLAYLPPELGKVGSQFTVEIRDKEIPAKVIPTPFYKRNK